MAKTTRFITFKNVLSNKSLSDEIRQYTNDVIKDIYQITSVYAVKMRTRARQLAPKRTGALAASIYLTRPQNSNGTRLQSQGGGDIRYRAFRGYQSASQRAIEKVSIHNDNNPNNQVPRLKQTGGQTGLSNGRKVSLKKLPKPFIGSEYQVKNKKGFYINGSTLPFNDTGYNSGKSQDSFFLNLTSSVPYAYFVEEGHQNYAGVHFIGRAVNEYRPQMIAAIRERLNRR